MNRSKTLVVLAATVFATAALAQTAPAPQLPDYSKTPAELAALAPTGGAGGSGNAKVQVVAWFKSG
jgi:hypothetical protein